MPHAVGQFEIIIPASFGSFIGYSYRILAAFVAYYIISSLIVHIINLNKIESNTKGT